MIKMELSRETVTDIAKQWIKEYATDDDLTEMGLCRRKSEFEPIERVQTTITGVMSDAEKWTGVNYARHKSTGKILDLSSIDWYRNKEGVTKDLGFMEPFNWRVNDYALCPDGKTRRVTDNNCLIKFELVPGLGFHDDVAYRVTDCIPVNEPDAPKLPWACSTDGDNHIMFDDEYFHIDAVIALYKTDEKCSGFNWDSTIKELEEYREWLVVTRRMEDAE